MKYISYKESKISEEERIKNNQSFIKASLVKEKEYFDEMFKKIDNTIILDEEQRKIILNDEDNLMVIAGAGSGKTTTISAKVNYLIEKQKIKDEEIVIISYTNKAVNELKERINNDFNHNVKITTFHKLGYEILKKEQKNLYILKNNKIIEEYIENIIIKDTKKLKKFLELYLYYFDISEELLLFSDYDKYLKYKNKNKYETLKSKIEYINNEIHENIKNRNEQLIADFLYMKNIDYNYQETYKYNKSYKPDFTIYYENRTYYIEYFNINKLKKFKYKKNINAIRKIHKKNKTVLIEIYDEENIIEDLEYKLKDKKIKLIDRNEKEIFEKIIQAEKNKAYAKFTNFCYTFLNLYKSKGYTQKDFCCLPRQNKRTKIFLEFIEELYTYYEKQLKEKNIIDFNDMINKANDIIKTKEKIEIKYKYIIIDEYQDISDSRFNLIKSISEKINTKIMVVGDDWQCIYSFASSNINLFTQFEKNVQKCEILKITNTYRNSQELIDIAGKFILQNKYQIKKKLKSNKNISHPVTIKIYKTKKLTKSLIEVIEYLIKKYGPNKNILILGRYTFDKNKIIDNKIIKENNGKIIYSNYPGVKIEYMTIHSSKGLGYDNVILINLTDALLGFPSKIKTDPILELLITKDEYLKYAEERRLFYVALTRTKNEIILLTPIHNQSEFINEIKKQKNILIKK